MRGLPVTVAELRNESGWIDWNLFTHLMVRLETLMGGADALEEMGREHFKTSTFAFMRRIASFLVRPRDLYWMGTSWFGPTLFTIVEDEFEDLGDGWLRETLRIPPAYRDCPQLFHVLYGALRAAPRLLGRPDSLVKLEIRPREATYLVKPPPRASISMQLRTWLRPNASAPSLIEELTVQQERLKRGHVRLRSANDTIALQTDRLRRINRMGRELARHIELTPLTDSLMRLLQNLLPGRGIAIWLQSMDGDGVTLLRQTGETQSPPSSTYSMEAGSRPVGRLQIWHPSPGGSGGDPELLEELVPWIAMALDNARAHEALRTYSSQLEWRVKESGHQLEEINAQLRAEKVEREQTAAALMRSEEQLRSVERLASIGTLTTGITQQIIDPMAAILIAAEYALQWRGESGAEQEMIRSLEEIHENATRSGRILKNVLQFSRNETGDRWSSDLNEVVIRAAAVTEPYAYEREVHVDLELALGKCPAHMNPLQIEQVVVSLVRNAIEAGGAGSRALVRTEAGTDCARVVVEDDGPGIDAKDHARVFDPFYSTKWREGSVGLGLSVARGIVTAHGGTIEIASKPERGTRIIVELPARDPEGLASEDWIEDASPIAPSAANDGNEE